MNHAVAAVAARDDSAQGPTAISELVMTWRQRAAQLDPYAPSAAHALRETARELEEAIRADGSELLTLSEAALISGYSVDHLGRLVRDGRLPNHGRAHKPLLRRADLPRKPSALSSGPENAYDVAADVRSLLGRRGERL